MDTPLDKFPVLIRGGSILPIRQRVRRASPLMWQDPFTLIVALAKDGSARGQLYLDDGVGYGHERGELVWRDLTFTPKGKNGGLLSSSNKVHSEGLVGVAEVNAWAQVSVKAGGVDLQWHYDEGVGAKGKKEGGAGKLVIKNPGVSVVESWEIEVA
jgi:alpha 1,3-glucosidase